MERRLNGFLLMVVLLGAAVPLLTQAQDDLELLLRDVDVNEERVGSVSVELNRCGIALLAECAKADPGTPVLISPFSIDSAFAMLWLGASGKAKEEIGSTLGFPEELKEFAEANRFLSASKEPKLLTSNSIWVDRRFPLSKSYSDLVGGYFPFSLYDFDNTKSNEAAGRMNEFVSERTYGMIRNVIGETDIRPYQNDEDMGTGLVLINTLYFKGRWKKPFDRGDTLRRQDFNGLDGTAQYVDLMCDTRRVLYGEGPAWQSVALPYRGGKFDFVAVLPTPALDVETLLARLSRGSAFQELMDSCSNTLVKVKLPKLDFEYKTSLADRLKARGMERPFESDIHSFPAITGGKDNRYVDRVDKVIHATRIKMDEEQTEAAAATAVTCCWATSGCSRPEPPIPEFTADHPFLAFIVERTTGLVLFAGVIQGIGAETHFAASAEELEGREEKRRSRFARNMKQYLDETGARSSGKVIGWTIPADDDGDGDGDVGRNGFRTIGVNAFGGLPEYENGNRYLSTTRNHISGEALSMNDRFLRLNLMLSLGAKVKCSACGDEHLLCPEDVTVVCPVCNGSGVAECWWCGRSACVNCGGTGRRRYCLTCHGEGRIWRWWGWKTDCPDCRNEHCSDKCPTPGGFWYNQR